MELVKKIAYIRIYGFWTRYDIFDSKIWTKSVNGIVIYCIINHSIMFIWGILSFSMTAVVNREGLIALRFFQGVVQSGYAFITKCVRIFSSILVYILYFYTREEVARRIALTISISAIIREIWGLIFHSLSQRSQTGLPGWKV
jgi:hypothetical protein